MIKTEKYMLGDKLKFQFSQALKSEQLQSVQQDTMNTVESDHEHGEFADCDCKQIDVYIDVTSILNPYYRASFTCRCGCKRDPLEARPIKANISE